MEIQYHEGHSVFIQQVISFSDTDAAVHAVG